MSRRRVTVPEPAEADYFAFPTCICPDCRRPLPRNSEQFGADAHEPDGFHRECRHCHNEQTARSYARGKGRAVTVSQGVAG